MKHRDRVRMALSHQETDRCPLQVSFTPEFATRLRTVVNISGGAHHNPHGGGNTYELERTLDEDMLLTSVGWANSYYASDAYNPGGDSYTDEWGIEWKNSRYATPFGEGVYTEVSRNPLADDSAIASYRAPDPERPELYAESDWVLRTFKGEYWIVGATVCTAFETAWALRGYAKLLMDFASDPDKAEAVLDIPFRYHLRAAERLVRMGVDMIWIGDEVLNPVQPLSMDPVQLKREYGKKLCFWGTIDEQRTLPFGTTEEVRAEVISRLSTIGKGRRPHQSAPYPPCSARHPCGEPASSCGCGLLHDLRLL